MHSRNSKPAPTPGFFSHAVFPAPDRRAGAARPADTGRRLLALALALALSSIGPAAMAGNGNIVRNGDFTSDLSEWTSVTAGTASWSPNGFNPGSAFISQIAPPSGQVVGLRQCIALPAPGTWALNGYAMSPGTGLNRDIPSLLWVFRANSASCTGPATADGQLVLPRSGSFVTAAAPALITVPSAQWNANSTLELSLRVNDGDFVGTNAVRAHFDAITLERMSGQAVQRWPEAAPCNTSLQNCIDATAAGDIIEIATDAPITETIEILGKSLTLRPAPGFAPVFQATTFTDVIQAFGGDADVTVLIEGLTVRNGSIELVARGAGTFAATLHGNTVEDLDLSGNRRAILVKPFGTEAHGSMHFDIEDNTVRLDFQPGHDVSAIRIEPLRAEAFGRIVGNHVLGEGLSSLDAAIRIDNDASVLAVDVIGNIVVSRGYNGGVRAVQRSAGGALDVRIVNNLISTGTETGASGAAGVALRVEAGEGSFFVVNNTIAGNPAGLRVVAGDAIDALNGVLANNLVADNLGDGIAIGALVAPDQFFNRNNLVFGNGQNAFIPGPGTVFADPRFVAGSFRLRPESPARDAGDTDLVPSDTDTDLDGGARVLGTAVDIGAYESSADPIFVDGFDGFGL